MKIKVILISAIVFFPILTLTISCSHQKAEWKGTIEEGDGVTIVKNPEEPTYGEDALSLEEDLFIGEAEGREDYMFSQIRSIAVDEKGRIYVLDTKEAHVKVFDKNGDYIKTIGRKGQGPGEMSLPFAICITRQNEIVVQDLNNRSIMFYSLDGNFIKSLSTAKIILVGFKIDSRGNIIGIISIRGPDKQVIELQKFDSELSYLYSFGSFSFPSRGSTFNPFMSELCWAVSKEDNVICGYPENYEFKLFNPEGKIIRKVIKDYKPIKITQEEIEERKKRLPGPMKLDIPQYHSTYQDLSIDEENRIFVQTWEKLENEEGYYYDVFDSEGKFIAKVHLKFPPRIWKRNKLYSIEENEEGFQFVMRYKVTWKY